MSMAAMGAPLLELQSTSKEYVKVPVTVTAGGEPVTDPVVSIALRPEGTSGLTWLPATWVDNAVRYLVGPLAPGRYGVYIRVEDSPEDIIKFAGIINAV